MIQFIKPYFSDQEIEVFKTKTTPFSKRELEENIRKKFKPGWDVLIQDSGEACIQTIVNYYMKTSSVSSISIPTVICGSVLRAVSQCHEIQLMDCENDWNCKYDSYSKKADILLYAHLSGKFKKAPDTGLNISQIVIEDCAQKFFIPESVKTSSSYLIFSFGNGKQLYAGRGGIIVSPTSLDYIRAASMPYSLHAWNLSLIDSQIDKIKVITAERKRIAGILIDELKNIDWLTLPDPENHDFSKFIVFIDQPLQREVFQRTKEIVRFIYHMQNLGIAVEETYIPLHLRFQKNFNFERMKNFKANELWYKAITLPCRPNLSESEIDQIVNAVKRFDPITKPMTVKEAYEKNYKKENYETQKSGYFSDLHDLKIGLIKKYFTKSKDKVLDLGCGAGIDLIPLRKEGYFVDGVDFVNTYFNEITHALQLPLEDWDGFYLYTHAISNMTSVPSEYYDGAYSFSTLYYIKEIEEAIFEISRVMKKGAIAILEFGNINSLNTIEASLFGISSEIHHADMRYIAKVIEKSRMKILEKKCFQVFPLYGGHDEKMVERRMVDILRHQMSMLDINGVMLDERVSSSPFIEHFAFRHILVLQKLMVHEKPQKIEYFNNKIVPSKWIEKKLRLRRLEANSKMAKEATWHDGFLDLIELLKENPGDAITVKDIMKQHSSYGQKSFVETTLLPALRDEINKEVKKEPKKMNGIKVSVVVPTYNQMKNDMLPKLVRSLQAQTFDKQNFEVIIVNDGSTDGTKEFLEGLLANKSLGMLLKVIHQENKKLPGALNTGMKEASGEYLTWVSSDCFCEDTFIEALSAALDANPSAAMAYSEFFFINEKDFIKGKVSNPDYGYRSLIIRNEGNASFMYRRSCAEEIGEYDVDLNGAEDWDYWIRLAEKWPFVFVPEPLYYYRLHPESMQNTIPKEVNESIIKMFNKMFERIENKLDLKKLYPTVTECSNQHEAAFIGFFDFGSKSLAARVFMGTTAINFLQMAADLTPEGNPFVWINLSMAHAQNEQWDQAKFILSKAKIEHESQSFLFGLIDELNRVYSGKDSQALYKIPVPCIDLDGTEIFTLEKEKRLVYHF